MRRLVILALLVTALLPTQADAQDDAADPARDDVLYQGMWCLALTAQPYRLDAPDDVVCEYRPRPMDRDEAVAYYAQQVAPHNHVIDRWNCAEEQTRKGLTWKRAQEWAGQLAREEQRLSEALAAVDWPAEAAPAVAELVALGLEKSQRRVEAYGYPTRKDAVGSGAWARLQRSSARAAEVARELRARLDLTTTRGSDACTKVRRYEARLADRPTFIDPFGREDLTQVAAILAQAGLVASQVDEMGKASLFLTGAGLDAARQMPTIDPEATPEDVVATLFHRSTPGAPGPSPAVGGIGPVPSDEPTPSPSGDA